MPSEDVNFIVFRFIWEAREMYVWKISSSVWGVHQCTKCFLTKHQMRLAKLRMFVVITALKPDNLAENREILHRKGK